MTRESGKRTRLRFGAVSAEVSLVKASTKPSEAQHETRRVLVERTADPTSYPTADPAPVATDPFGDPVAAPVDAGPIDLEDPANRHIRSQLGAPDPMGEGLPPGLLGPMGDPTWPARETVETETGRDPEADPDWAERSTEPQRQRVEHDVDPTHPDTPAAPDDLAEQHATAEALAGMEAHSPGADALPPAPAPTAAPGAPVPAPTTATPAAEYVPPATRVEQGVHLENGTWVDLTAQLAEVDARTKVDGLEVVRTIPASSYASERVRELHYLAGVNPGEYKVLALLWRALRLESAAAEVRWTKRTAQASGIILARGELGSKTRPAHLALLELEWASNLRKPSPRAVGPIGADVGVDEVRSAVELVQSFAAPAPRVELRDERLAKRAELLELARADRLAEYVPPPAPMPEDVAADADGLADALSLAAAWNREHAPV